MERFDVVVVGGRVAGSAVATHLSRAGLSVLVLEAGHLPSETLSTHLIQDLPALQRLGVLDELLAVAPPIQRSTILLDDVDLSIEATSLPWLCIRRVTLDEILSEAARRAGADIRFGSRVIGLSARGVRVTGVRVRTPSGEYNVATTLVVGADGRNSTIARLVAAPHYNASRNERAAVWRYFMTESPLEESYFHYQGEDVFLAAPCDHGLVMAGVQPAIAAAGAFRQDGQIERAFRRASPTLAAALHGAEPAGPVRAVLRFRCFFRQSAGPGWVLLGDAGHVKDVITGQGISDALRQAESLTVHLLAAWRDDDALDASLRYWWRLRDRDASWMYWFSQDLGQAGPLSQLWKAFYGRLAATASGRLQLREILTHRRSPRAVLRPSRILTATRDLLMSDGSEPSAVFDQLAKEVKRNVRRRWAAFARTDQMPPHKPPAPESNVVHASAVEARR